MIATSSFVVISSAPRVNFTLSCICLKFMSLSSHGYRSDPHPAIKELGLVRRGYGGSVLRRQRNRRQGLLLGLHPVYLRDVERVVVVPLKSVGVHGGCPSDVVGHHRSDD